MNIIELRGINKIYGTGENQVRVLKDIDLDIESGDFVAIIGQSGSGKSTSAMAVLGLLPGTGHVVNGSIKLDGEEIAGAKQSEFDKLRGTRMGLVPQDPMSNLNPVWRIGTQVKEALKAVKAAVDSAESKEDAINKMEAIYSQAHDLLTRAGMSDEDATAKLAPVRSALDSLKKVLEDSFVSMDTIKAAVDVIVDAAVASDSIEGGLQNCRSIRTNVFYTVLSLKLKARSKPCL